MSKQKHTAVPYDPMDDPIDVDILEMDMSSKGKPHWLDPIEKNKGRYDADRRRRWIQHAKAMRKKNK